MSFHGKSVVVGLGPRGRSAFLCCFVVSVGGAASCGEPAPQVPEPVRPASLEDAFSYEGVVRIEEDPTDSIAEPGYFVERRADGFLLSDRFLPRVRAYDRDGALVASYGRPGEGPGEFIGVRALAEVASNRVAVLDSRLHRITYLTSDLEFEAFVGLPGSASNIVALDSGVLAVMRLAQGNPAARLVGKPPLVHRMTESGDVTWSGYPASFTMLERPYWPSLAGYHVATAGDSIFVMTSLMYPATILSSGGEVVGALGTPSASFREIPVFERREFADFDNQQGEFADGGFDQVDRIDVVSGSHLVMTRRRQRGLALRGSHDFLEVYDLRNGIKLYEDVPLPEGSRVLGGGRSLYLLLDQDFPPWRVAKLRLRTDAGSVPQGGPRAAPD